MKLKQRIYSIDILAILTFLSLFFKNIILVGYMQDPMHEHSKIRSALLITLKYQLFRPFYYIGFLLLVFWFIYLFKNKGRAISSITVNVIISFLLLVDLWYLRGFNTLPTLHILLAGGNLGDSISSFLALVAKKDVIFMLDIPFFILYAIARKKKYKYMPSNIPAAAFLLVFGICSIAVFAPLANKLTSKTPMDWIFYRLDATATINNISPIGYEQYSSYLFFNDKSSISLSKQQVNNIQQWYKYKNENLPDNEYKGMFKGKNLIIIQVESLENFVINKKINGQEITPNLNKMLNNSLYFNNYHEQVGAGNSSDADLMTNASVYPIQMGATLTLNPSTKYNTLPMMLKNQGYYTSAIHPDAGSFWNWMPALSSMGFDKCYDSTNYKKTETINIGIGDGEYLSQVKPILDKQKQPFYSFIVTLSSHTPFDLPEKYRDLKLDEQLDKSKLGGYFQCIHYTDQQLGIFFDGLKQDGILDNSVVVMYGDHEGVHKYFKQDIEALPQKESWWLDNDKRIPLIIYQSSLQQGKTIETVGGQIDVMPTVAYLMGIDPKTYQNTAMGRNLLNTKKSFAVLRNARVLGNPNGQDKAHAVKGLEIADQIIRGNYFKNDYKP
jgi:uncharacterized sulfatase